MNKYYDVSDLLSYNKILNFVIGQRGGGKTFSAKKWCVNDFIKSGGKNQFVWVRRYKTEMKKLKTSFWDDIISTGIFKDVEFSVNGDKLMINGEVSGYLVPLSTSQQMKSSSYPNVTKIIYDEFVIEKSSLRYLSNEVESFLSLMDTIIRDRDNCRAVLIANNIQVTNPYFDYFKIRGDQSKRFVKKDDMIIEFYTNEVYAEERIKTRFGRLIKDTEYGEFSLYNKPLLDNPLFIEQRTKQARFCYALLWKGVYIGVWKDNKQDKLYLSDKYDRDGLVFTLTTDDHQPKMLYLKQFKNMANIKALKYAYSVGSLCFENQMIKRYFIDEILSCI